MATSSSTNASIPRVACGIYDNVMGLTLPSLMLLDTEVGPEVYSTVFILISLIGLLSNLLTLVTSFRPKIFETSCGIYLAIHSAVNIVLMIFLSLNIPALFCHEREGYKEFHCHAHFYICLTLNYGFVWGSVAIIIEKLLIERFNFSMHGSRLRPTLISVIIFIVVAISNLPEKFSRRFQDHSNLGSICVYDSNSSSSWYQTHIAISFIHIIGPSLIHLLSIGCILATIVRRRVLITMNINSHQNRTTVWLRELKAHRDFLIPPCVFLICILPHTIAHYLLISKCFLQAPLSLTRLHIGLVLLLDMPQVLTFVLYIYPNEIYFKEFMQTCIYRSICPASYRRQIQERRPTRTTTTTDSNKILFQRF